MADFFNSDFKWKDSFTMYRVPRVRRGPIVMGSIFLRWTLYYVVCAIVLLYSVKKYCYIARNNDVSMLKKPSRIPGVGILRRERDHSVVSNTIIFRRADGDIAIYTRRIVGHPCDIAI